MSTAVVVDDRAGSWRRMLGPVAWVVLEEAVLSAASRATGGSVDAPAGPLVAPVSVRALAARVGVGREAAGAAVARLVSTGLLVRLPPARSTGGQFAPGGYVLRLPPGLTAVPADRPARAESPSGAEHPGVAPAIGPVPAPVPVPVPVSVAPCPAGPDPARPEPVPALLELSAAGPVSAPVVGSQPGPAPAAPAGFGVVPPPPAGGDRDVSVGAAQPSLFAPGPGMGGEDVLVSGPPPVVAEPDGAVDPDGFGVDSGVHEFAPRVPAGPAVAAGRVGAGGC